MTTTGAWDFGGHKRDYHNGTPSFYSSHCKSFEDWVPIDFIYEHPIFKWVAVMWTGWYGTIKTVPVMTTRWQISSSGTLSSSELQWLNLHDRVPSKQYHWWPPGNIFHLLAPNIQISDSNYLIGYQYNGTSDSHQGTFPITWPHAFTQLITIIKISHSCTWQ